MQIIFEDSNHRVVSAEDSAELRTETKRLQHYAFGLAALPKNSGSTENRQEIDPWLVIAAIDKEDKVVASIDITNQDIYLKGRVIGHGGLGGVCSYPETRRQGNIRKAIKGTLMYLRDKGMAVSGLYPFKFEFYRQFGWELGQKAFSYTIPIRELEQFKRVPGKVYRCKFGPNDNIGPDLDRLKNLYNRWAPKYGGSFSRTDHWWANRVLEGTSKNRFASIYIDESGRETGYMIYTFERNDKVSELRANEIVYENLDALKGLFSFVYSHDSMVRDFRWRAPYNFDLLPLLAQPRIEVKLETGMMFRVVDIKAVLEHLSKDYSGPELCIAVTDDTAEWNDGLYVINGKGSAVGPLPVSEACDKRTARFTIQRFSQAVCGYAPVKELVESGLIDAGPEVSLQDLDRLFRPAETYCAFMNDHF